MHILLAVGHSVASPKDMENIDEDDKPKQQQESKEAEASTADTSDTMGSAERAEQDQRAMAESEGKEPSKENATAEGAKKE